MHPYLREEWIIGREALMRLRSSRVVIFGIGGVGSFVAEGLARAGIGILDLVDGDAVSITNLNRQLVALHSTIGKKKVNIMRDRINDIDPETVVHTHDCFYTESTYDLFRLENYDYIVDAMDMVTAKLHLIEEAVKKKIPIISCMGVGNKIYPEKLQITDLQKTTTDPLAKVMRKELRERGITRLKVLFSTEGKRERFAEKEAEEMERVQGKRQSPGSISFVPSVAGLMIAGEVVRTIGEIR